MSQVEVVNLNEIFGLCHVSIFFFTVYHF